MELQLASKGLEFTLKKKKWVALMAAFGLTCYGFHKVYHFPAIAQKRNRLLKLLGALVSITESISDCAETFGVFSKDLNGFLQSESNQVPNTFKQVSKITSSDEFSQSISKVTQALTAGFASAVVGSFARNLVTSDCSDDAGDSNSNRIPSWLNVVCRDEFRNLIGDCIQVFVSSMVCVYLEKTKDANTFDEFFSGLTNPKHETQVRDLLVTVSNGAMETLLRTSHQVFTAPNPTNSDLYEEEDDELVDDGWVRKVALTLAEPKNKKLVLDLSGRIAFETARSFIQALLEVLSQGMQKYVKFVHETVVGGGVEIVRYVATKSSVVAAVSLSLCLHIFGGVWILVPA